MGLASSGQADARTEKQEASALFKQGNKLFMEADYAGAVRRFRAAYALYPSYKLDYNIAAAEEELGNTEQAVFHYRRFVKDGGGKAPAALLAKARQRLKQLTGEGAASSRTDPPGPRGPDGEQEGRDSRTLWAYITLGLGAASTVTAAVLYGVGASQGEAAYDDYQNAVGNEEISRSHRDVENARTKLIAGHVLMGVAAASFVASIYLFVSRPEVALEGDEVSAVGITPLEGGAFMSLSRRF